MKFYFVLFVHIIILGLFIASTAVSFSQSFAKPDKDQTKINPVWVADHGDGTYRNPILFADYSDPDVIRVADDYYMVASSFSHFPGLPILHSKDLVNWKIIGHAAQKYPYDEFDKPQHGMAIWAPSIRYHKGEYYIYFGDPDRGVFLTKAQNPAGPWEPLSLIRRVTGWIDPCPFWDDDGNAYLVHAWANSRVGIKSILAVNRMNKDGTEILDDGVVVYVGHSHHPTIEGPKLYKRNEYYYIFAPAGGVKPGWQTVLRSKSIFGPYEDKVVLEQGSTKINGPHQGAWVDTKTGEDWFVHFQDRYAYGRLVHLQPMRWENSWPVIGVDYDKNGIGEPVLNYRKPNVGATYSLDVPQTTDEFDSTSIGFQWQWEANYKTEWISLSARKGWLRFYSQSVPLENKNLWSLASLLTQKIPAPAFHCTTKLEFISDAIGEMAGLLVYGLDYAYIAIERTNTGYRLAQTVCIDADKGTQEETMATVEAKDSCIFFRIDVNPQKEKDIIPKVLCTFGYSSDGKIFQTIGKEFVVREGRWVGAKVGIFSLARNGEKNTGFADFDWFRFSELSH
jgi:beta-xylosidase